MSEWGESEENKGGNKERREREQRKVKESSVATFNGTALGFPIVWFAIKYGNWVSKEKVSKRKENRREREQRKVKENECRNL